MRDIGDKYDILVEDDIPVYEHDEFADGSHLNEVGARRFTEYVRNLLNDSNCQRT